MGGRIWTHEEARILWQARGMEGKTCTEARIILEAAGFSRSLKAVEERWRRLSSEHGPAAAKPLPGGVSPLPITPEGLLVDLRAGEVPASREVLVATTSLQDEGYQIEVDLRRGMVRLGRQMDEARLAELAPETCLADEVGTQEIVLGLISDTHYGSKYSSASLIEKVLVALEGHGVQMIYHLGDLCDGDRVYRGHEYELQDVGADAQLERAVKTHPVLGVRQKILGGNHDESFVKRIGLDNVGRFCEVREDCDYLGYHAADVQITDQAKMVLMHPTGGVSYATSYKPQKFIEKEVPRPAIFAVGHYHVALMMPYTGTLAIMVPCLQEQTPYLRQKALEPALGAVLLKVRVRDDGKLSDVWWRWLSRDYV